MRLREYFQDLDKRGIALVIFTGLVVAWVRHGVQHHWKSWGSWEAFFVAWFIHTMALAVLIVAALAAIIFTHKFFLGYDKKDYGRDLTFYIVMTILVAALGIAIVANSPPRDDFDDSSASLIFFG
jgi:MFS superfamily sulfate permease-like transporter